MQPRAWYNEIEPYAAAWLRNLIAAGLIPPGDVDERSVVDILPDELAGYAQCHFFAGLGGWPYALRLAGWSDDRQVWTGSCPCQPFSVAGKRAGFDDARHLWPAFSRLIAERHPSTVFGEQVAGAADWLRLVRSDLETMGYAVGAIPMEAACAGADHFRDRYWFVADSMRQRLEVPVCQQGNDGAKLPTATRDGVRGLEHPAGVGWGEGWTEHEFRIGGFTAAVASVDGRQYVECADKKWRRLPPPRVRWLGTRIPARVAKLRAFGNAIDPRPASQFIAAYMEAQALDLGSSALKKAKRAT